MRLRSFALLIVGAAIVVGGGFAGYRYWLDPRDIPVGFISANGRIEATEIDVAAKYGGRVAEVLYDEGAYVQAGQVVARMDVTEAAAALRAAQAQVTRAQETKRQANFLIDQRQGELTFADKEQQRTQALFAKGFATAQKVDQSRTIRSTAFAALEAARSSQAAADAAILAAEAEADRLMRQVADGTLAAPRAGRVLYRLAEPGEVIGTGGKILTLLDLSDVYMTVFLPSALAGKIAIGQEARVIVDPLPDRAIPASVAFISTRAQFTPKQVETQSERDRMVFRAKLRVPNRLVEAHIDQVKTGVTGVAYLKERVELVWPNWLDSDLVKEAARQ
ncbi:HlyD family secretion protein [Lacibacterium aquatile]|uniref:HlyD family secretion protein n=1 Tax=Lacibacterium aquatile TaxID=1168082 RepID=A0ABW5DTS8_9PROT